MKTALKKSLIGLICLLGGISAFYPSQKNNSNSEVYLQLANIDALASNEGSSIHCIGSGSIDCNGRKVDLRLSVFSLPIYNK